MWARYTIIERDTEQYMSLDVKRMALEGERFVDVDIRRPDGTVSVSTPHLAASRLQTWRKLAARQPQHYTLSVDRSRYYRYSA